MKLYLKLICTFLFAFAASTVYAPPPAPGGGMNPSCWTACVPIDGGLVFLITAVALFGGVKIYTYQKKVKTTI